MAKSFPNTGATVIDTSADLPAASSALEGVMMFQKDTNELKICDGASWISMLDTDSPPGLTLISPTSVAGTGVTNNGGNITFSGSSTVSVNGVFNSVFDNYKFIINITNNTAVGALALRMRNAGTDNSSSNYTYAGLNSYSGSSITSALNSAGTTTYFVIGIVDNVNYANMPSTFEILQPFLSYRTAYYGFLPNPVNPQSYFDYMGGAMSVTTSYDGFSVLNASGGTLSGNIRVYGYRNSI